MTRPLIAALIALVVAGCGGPEKPTASSTTSSAAPTSTTPNRLANMTVSQAEALLAEVVELAPRWRGTSAREVAELGSKACDKLLSGGTLADAIDEVFVNTGRVDISSQDDAVAVKTLVMRSIPAMCPEAASRVE